MCLYICSRPCNAKNMTLKELLTLTERDTVVGSEAFIQVKSIEVCSPCFFYWISTLSHDSWAPVSFYPQSEHSEERCWPQLNVPSPTGTSRSIRLLFWMKRVVTRELWSMTNYFSYPHFLLSSIAIIWSSLSLYCILTWLQVFEWDQSVKLSLYVRLCFSSSVSVSLCANQPSELNEERQFCMGWICLNVLVLSV